MDPTQPASHRQMDIEYAKYCIGIRIVIVVASFDNSVCQCSQFVNDRLLSKNTSASQFRRPFNPLLPGGYLNTPKKK